MTSVLITEYMHDAAVDRLRARHEVAYEPQLFDDRSRLLASVAGVDALIVRVRTQVNAEVLAHAPRVRVIGRLGVGLDNIDLLACRARNIEVIPALGANADAVAEYVLLAAGLLLRGAFFVCAETAAGKWPRDPRSEGSELGGKTLGLIGFGSIGQATARKARALGLQIVAHDAHLPEDAAAWREHAAQRASFDEVLAAADIVSVHVPLLPQTRGMLDARRLAAMKRGAILINTARGGIVDEQALAAALQSGHLAGAAVDVFEHEPLPAGSPLAGAPNVLLTPHIAGVTREANVRVSGMVADRVLAALARLGK